MCAKWDKKWLLLIDFAPRESSTRPKKKKKKERNKKHDLNPQTSAFLYLPDVSMFLQAIKK